MENKRYLDKVVGSLVRSTKMDYENDEIHTPFPLTPIVPTYPFSFFSLHFQLYNPLFPFTKYCKNIYGLTVDEVEYVWKQYKEIIVDKIENGK